MKDHPATTPHEVLAGMLCYLTSDTYLLEPNPPELEQAMAALLDVVSRLPRNIRPELAEEVEFFHRRLNEIKSGSPLK